MKRLFFLFSFFLVLSGCSFLNLTKDSGTISVRLPSGENPQTRGVTYSVDEVSDIKIEVLSGDFNPSLSGKLDGIVTFENVPVGNCTVTARAFDINDHEIGSGSSSADVLPGETVPVSVVIVMKENVPNDGGPSDGAITTFAGLKNALAGTDDKIQISGIIEVEEALSVTRAVEIEGVGSNATLKRKEGVTGILLTASSDITINSIVFDGNKSNVPTSDSLLKVSAGNFSLSGCSFINNGSATKATFFASGCAGTIDSCTFGGNAENGNNCGAVYATEIGDFTIKNSTITKGTYTSGSAGITIAAGKTNAAVVDIESCIIQDNVSSAGGGIYIKNIGNSQPTTVNVYGGQLSGNSATSSGGFIHIEDYSDGTQLTVNIGKEGYNTSITGNTSGSNGGGVYVKNTCAINLMNVEISGNSCGSSSNGGGIYTSTKTTVFLGNSVKIINNTRNGLASNAYFGMSNVSYNGNTYNKQTNIAENIQ